MSFAGVSIGRQLSNFHRTIEKELHPSLIIEKSRRNDNQNLTSPAFGENSKIQGSLYKEFDKNGNKQLAEDEDENNQNKLNQNRSLKDESKFNISDSESSSDNNSEIFSKSTRIISKIEKHTRSSNSSRNNSPSSPRSQISYSSFSNFANNTAPVSSFRNDNDNLFSDYLSPTKQNLSEEFAYKTPQSRFSYRSPKNEDNISFESSPFSANQSFDSNFFEFRRTKNYYTKKWSSNVSFKSMPPMPKAPDQIRIPEKHSPNFILSDGSNDSPTQKYIEAKSAKNSVPNSHKKFTFNNSSSPLSDEDFLNIQNDNLQPRKNIFSDYSPTNSISLRRNIQSESDSDLEQYRKVSQNKFVSDDDFGKDKDIKFESKNNSSTAKKQMNFLNFKSDSENSNNSDQDINNSKDFTKQNYSQQKNIQNLFNDDSDSNEDFKPSSNKNDLHFLSDSSDSEFSPGTLSIKSNLPFSNTTISSSQKHDTNQNYNFNAFSDSDSDDLTFNSKYKTNEINQKNNQPQNYNFGYYLKQVRKVRSRSPSPTGKKFVFKREAYVKSEAEAEADAVIESLNASIKANEKLLSAFRINL